MFDASSKPDEESPSLNDCLETGPPLQRKIWNILVRNRMRPVTVTGDIKQAFLQIRIRKEDRDVLRFHWINNRISQQIIILRFARAVFGLVQSPFFLGGTLESHLDGYKEEPEVLIEQFKEDMYVDDVIGGGNTVEEGKTYKDKIIAVLGDAKFELHKWHSNVKELESDENHDANEEDTYAKQQIGLNTEKSAILGVPWDKNEDTIAVKFPDKNIEISKRGLYILKYLASVYDPLGLISPVLLTMKILYRDICDTKIGWDKELTPGLVRRWKSWSNNLPDQIKVPRSISPMKSKIDSLELHVFADASKEGVSAVIYAVTRQDETVHQNLLSSKSRISKRDLSIPRLELVAAHMAANLLQNAKKAISFFPITESQAWSDSTVVLHWIKGNGQYKQFVSNRVNKIKAISEVTWRYVNTAENPADVGSRGCRANQLQESWFQGPKWLSDRGSWPKDIVTKSTTETEMEAKRIKEVFAAAISAKDDDQLNMLLTKYNLHKILRVTAWIKRFIYNTQLKKSVRIGGPLTTDDIERAKVYWVRQTQQEYENADQFQEDKGKLNLQRDKTGIYRCMGRIVGDYPIYLPPKNIFSEKIVEDAHLCTLHGGVGLTMTKVRRRYWIPKLRQLTKQVRHKCNGCKRLQTTHLPVPPPGLLPTDRTKGDRPFQVVGVDYAGPFISTTRKRDSKVYILLFAFSLTRAIYIELMRNQTVEEFVKALKRLIARRGRPEVIYSDNAKTFVAADKWLKQVLRKEDVNDILATNEIRWKFNLSRAPWWGGQFERIIGLVKQTLFKVVGKSTLTWDKFEEVILDIEATLNSRPLDYVEDDIQLPILTPNLLMLGNTTVALPDEDPMDIENYDLRKKAKYVISCKNQVWRRLTTEYLKALRERHNLKHQNKQMKSKEGDVVIIKGDDKNRAHWKLGVVKKMYEGSDDVVRAVKLRAGKSYMERAVQHLYPLELSCDKTNGEESELNPKSPEFRPRRNAAEIARLNISDQAEIEQRSPHIE